MKVILDKMKVFLVFAIVCSLLGDNVHGVSFGIRDFGRSTLDTGIGIAKKVPDLIPTPDAFFQLGINAIAGYPFDVAYKIVNTFCKWPVKPFVKSRKSSRMFTTSLT